MNTKNIFYVLKMVSSGRQILIRVRVAFFFTISLRVRLTDDLYAYRGTYYIFFDIYVELRLELRMTFYYIYECTIPFSFSNTTQAFYTDSNCFFFRNLFSTGYYSLLNI